MENVRWKMENKLKTITWVNQFSYMKNKLVLLLLILPIYVCGQIKTPHFREGNKTVDLSKEAIALLKKYDFSSLWTFTDNAYVYGFIGENHQRIRVKILKVTKDSLNEHIYHISGKTMVKTNICEFSGDIFITKIRKYEKTSTGVDGEFANKVTNEYSLTGNYIFFEGKTQVHTGVFKGIFQTDFYLDKQNKLHYDDLNYASDSFTNNQFVGSWKSYSSNLAKLCNWGDYRIPNSGNFDIGAGDFSPNTKDVSLGWQTVIESYHSEKAKKEETSTWWK